jgi:trans-aconitate 2-methyltransferase
MAHEWDATTYDSLTLPHVAWGLGVLGRMSLAGTERVMDAGCGTGRDAAALLARWPEVDLVVLDGSAQMLDVARTRLGDAATYVHADLTEPLPVEPVDAVMSVAAFHWVRDHDALFAHLAAAMRPGARLTTDCGGRGNVADLTAAIASVTGVPDDGWEFAGVDDTRDRLERAGFDVADVRLREHPFRIDDPAAFEAYLGAVCLSGYLKDLPDAEHVGFVRAVAAAFDEPVVDYVRLEIDAIRR